MARHTSAQTGQQLVSGCPNTGTETADFGLLEEVSGVDMCVSKIDGTDGTKFESTTNQTPIRNHPFNPL